MKINCKYSDIANIDSLILNDKNPNRHPDNQIDLLARILKYQGWRHPVIVSTLSNKVCAGHGRILAARKNGWTEVPIDYQSFENEAQELAFLISDNTLSELSETDKDLVKEIALSLPPDFELDMLAIPDFTIEEPKVFEGNEDEVPEHVEPIAKLGDVFLLGEHRLMCGDSTDKQTVEYLLAGNKVDMVFTDPPYNQETSGGFTTEIGAALRKQSKEIEHLCDFEPSKFLSVLPIAFNGTMNSYVFTSKDLLPDYLMWAKDNGYSFNVLVWKKPTAIPIGGSHRPDIEYLLTFRKSGIFNSGLDGVTYSKVLEHQREQHKVHPTMKPVALLENQIKISSNDSVLDLFGGSGSTLIACEKTNRKCFMMELDPHYCDVIIARWEKFTGKKAVLSV